MPDDNRWERDPKKIDTTNKRCSIVQVNLEAVYFEDLLDNYPALDGDSRRPVLDKENKAIYGEDGQCAIRVSLALLGAGVSFEGTDGLSVENRNKFEKFNKDVGRHIHKDAKNLKGELLANNPKFEGKKVCIKAEALAEWLDKMPFVGLGKKNFWLTRIIN